MRNKFNTTLSVNLNQELYDLIESEAQKTYSTKAQVMRRLISALQPKAEA